MKLENTNNQYHIHFISFQKHNVFEISEKLKNVFKRHNFETGHEADNFLENNLS